MPSGEGFKKALLEKKVAHMSIQYADGRIEKKVWNARKIKQSSSIIGNLRSRPEFRQGKWKKAGIVKLVVTVPGTC
jgi:hypothetical protein